MKLYIHCSVCGGGGWANINDLTGDYTKVKHEDPSICERIIRERKIRQRRTTRELRAQCN